MANETKKYGTNDYLNNINWQLKRIADQLERLNNRLDPEEDIFSHLGDTDKPPRFNKTPEQVENATWQEIFKSINNK